MLEIIANLAALQDLDVEIRQIEKELRELAPLLTQSQTDITKRADSLKKAQDAISALGAQQRQLEGELKARESALAKFRQQQTLVRTPKELEAVSHEIDKAESDVSLLEDRILSLIEQQEAQSAKLAEAQAHGVQHDTHAAEKVARIQASIAEKETLLRGLREDRIVAANRIPEDLMRTYDWHLKTHGPTAVARMDKETCLGCGAAIVPSFAMQVATGQELHTCPNCNRFLYVRDRK